MLNSKFKIPALPAGRQNSKFILLIFVFYFLSGCDSLNQPVITPQLEVKDPCAWDFGHVKEGVVLKHNFILKNESSNTLNIKDINTSCGCTVSGVEKKTLLPGENTLLKVQFDTRGYSGHIEQYIYVHADSPDNPIIRFVIKADIMTNKR